MRGICSKKAWFYQVGATGQKGLLSFETSYGVVADSAQEGLDFARDIESAEVGPTLALLNEHVVESSPGALKGVYSFTDWIIQRL
jgi:hypothetical protein